jgi:hypothetical protein
VLTPTFTYLSMTERSEYTTSETEYAADLVKEGIAEGTPSTSRSSSSFARASQSI